MKVLGKVVTIIATEGWEGNKQKRLRLVKYMWVSGCVALSWLVHRGGKRTSRDLDCMYRKCWTDGLN